VKQAAGRQVSAQCWHKIGVLLKMYQLQCQMLLLLCFCGTAAHEACCAAN
jgi:hypothetical protein